MTTTDYQPADYDTNHDHGAPDNESGRETGAPRRTRRPRPGPGVLDNAFTAQLVADEIRVYADRLEAEGDALPSRVALLRQASAEIIERVR